MDQIDFLANEGIDYFDKIPEEPSYKEKTKRRETWERRKKWKTNNNRNS